MKFKIWAISVVAMAVISYFLFEYNVFNTLWESDSTRISVMILGVTMFYFARLGKLCRISDRGEVSSPKAIDSGFEASEVVMSLGMIGTVIGFIIMTGSFANVDFENIENLKQLFSLATNGMSTALYTTLTGLICHVLLRVGYTSLEKSIEN